MNVDEIEVLAKKAQAIGEPVSYVDGRTIMAVSRRTMTTDRMAIVPHGKYLVTPQGVWKIET
jgi:hypothetical protein